jgi:hypothetical protein
MKSFKTLVGVTASGLLVLAVNAPALASTPGGTQTDTVTVTQAGPPPTYLTLAMPAGPVAFGSVAQGGQASWSTGVSTVQIGDFVPSPTSSWDLEVAATDMMSGANSIPFTDLSVGSSTGCAPSATTTVQCESRTDQPAFTGTDATPGTTFSSSIVLADEICDAVSPNPSAPIPCVDGQWTTDFGFGLSVPATQTPATYSGTLQYTLNG